jgi:hypothetical protein
VPVTLDLDLVRQPDTVIVCEPKEVFNEYQVSAKIVFPSHLQSGEPLIRKGYYRLLISNTLDRPLQLTRGLQVGWASLAPLGTATYTTPKGDRLVYQLERRGRGLTLCANRIQVKGADSSKEGGESSFKLELDLDSMDAEEMEALLNQH